MTKKIHVNKAFQVLSFLMLFLVYSTSIQALEQQGVQNDTGQNALWLAGSWGVTFPVYGGERLDEEVAGGYDLRAGAQEIVDELPAVGHIICNLSYFANSHYFTLRLNDNLDVAKEIHESLVPSLENEQIIFDVLKTFKDAGKKVILYISTNYLDRADDETQAAWVAYYTREHNGDEYAAYKFLVQGFISRIKDYADGYWLDTASELLAEGHMDDFYSMIRALDPDAAITGGGGNSTLRDENGDEIKTDTEGFDDEDTKAHEIRIYVSEEEREDFTNGHVIGLQSGLLPNSWAYDEFTVPNMVAEPWNYYETDSTLKHAWFPMRESWHGYRSTLVFEVEQAYRFVRKITDAKAGVTLATTTDGGTTKKGYMMRDEMAIMKEINNRLLMSPMPAYEPYFRPPGAYLLGEERADAVLDPLNAWYHNNTPRVSKASKSGNSNGVFRTSVNTPYTQGNASRSVSKFIRKTGDEAYVKFTLPGEISDPALAVFKIRVYTVANTTVTNNDISLSLRKDGNAETEILVSHAVLKMDDWVDYTFDMSDSTFAEESYNEIYLSFASDDTDNDAVGNSYFIDAFQGISGEIVEVTFIVRDAHDELVADAEVTVDARTVMTNEVGEAEILLIQGSYGVNLSKTDYSSTNQTVDIESDSTVYLAFEDPFGTVEFHIMAGNDYATRSIVTLNGRAQRADDLGVVVFEDLEKGKLNYYSVKNIAWPEISSTFTLTNDTVINIQLDASASLSEEKNNTVRFYPNPVQGLLTLDMGSLVMTQYKLFNMDGQLIRVKSLEKDENTIDFSAVSAGLYLLEMSNEKQVVVKKIRKM